MLVIYVPFPNSKTHIKLIHSIFFKKNSSTTNKKTLNDLLKIYKTRKDRTN